ncbi:MAG: hypothetical protein JWM80_6043 [Cyanobacteria bacterium RYN_339]|nr:hypothetical protein [Cyanobacteria bacterium RYN_339]
MEEREARNKLQCVVDEGILLNRRDMVRVLRDLGHVRYQDLVEGTERARGEGYIAGVYANQSNSTIIVNKRLYINVNGFDYMRLRRADENGTAIDLVDDRRTIRITPLSDAMLERQQYITESTVMPMQGALERMLGVDPGEGFFEEDFDESDDL